MDQLQDLKLAEIIENNSEQIYELLNNDENIDLSKLGINAKPKTTSNFNIINCFIK